VYPNQVQFAWT